MQPLPKHIIPKVIDHFHGNYWMRVILWLKKIGNSRRAINSSLAPYMEIIFIWEKCSQHCLQLFGKGFLVLLFFPSEKDISMAPESRETLLSIFYLVISLVADFNAATRKCLAQNNLLFAL